MMMKILLLRWDECRISSLNFYFLLSLAQTGMDCRREGFSFLNKYLNGGADCVFLVGWN